MDTFFWIDGRLEVAANIQVSLLSHSMHYGSSIFEGLRFYETEEGSAIFRLKEHIDRFVHSAKSLKISLPYSVNELMQAIIATIQANSLRAGYIRPIAFFGEGDMELHPNAANLHVAIAVWPWAPRLGHQAIKVKISSFLRTPPTCTIISAKFAGHYANSILARQEARLEGFQEGLLLDHEGYIAEGPGANFFAVKNGTLFTPSETKIFAGITRLSIFALAEECGVEVKVQDLHPKEIPEFEEAFFTGTAVGIVPIESINGIKIGNGSNRITNSLRSAFQDLVHGRNKKYHHWLTKVGL